MMKLRRTGGVAMKVHKKASHYDAAWQKLRLAVLYEQPWCNVCERKVARHVDHIVPIADRPDLRLERSNLQPLCIACHRDKTAAEAKLRRNVTG